MKQPSRSRTPTRLRYIPEAAYPRGAETRARLIGTAIRLFSERGFEAASTRDIASAAALNTPALQYYFNNKEGLYAACAEHIVEQAWSVMRDVIMNAERLLAAGADDAALIGAFCDIQGRLTEFLDDAAGEWLLWMGREETTLGSSVGFLINHPKSKRITHGSRAIVARLLGRAANDPQTILHEMALASHLSHIHLTRTRTLALLKWKRIDPEGLALIKRVARQHALAALRAIVALRRAAPQAVLRSRGAKRPAPRRRRTATGKSGR